ncbi:MAG: hypothetical protein WCE75_09645 [Terracidiphilus sp.]
MQNRRIGLLGYGILLCLAATHLLAQSSPLSGRGRAVIVVSGNHNTAPAVDQLKLRVNGAATKIDSVERLQGAGNPIEMVVLLETGMISELGTVRNFFHTLPANTSVAFAYLTDYRTVLMSQLTSDPAQAQQAVIPPTNGPSRLTNPYICLSDLAKHWPSGNRHARRIVVIATSGIDPILREYTSDNVRLQSAVDDAVRAGIQVNTILWGNDPAGTNMLSKLAEETGGESFGYASNGAVRIGPYLDQVREQSLNEYLVTFSAPLDKKTNLAVVEIKTNGFHGHILAPRKVVLAPDSLAVK